MAKSEELLEDIRSRRPRLIVDTHNPRTPLNAFGVTPSQWEALQELIGAQYRVVGKVGPWTVHERR